MKYRKKPVVIDAFQFLPMTPPGVLPYVPDSPLWFLKAEMNGKVTIWTDDEEPYCMIQTLEGAMKAEVHDWIIKGVKDEIYSCKPDIFRATYEAVADIPEER